MRSEPSTHWVRSYRKRADPGLLKPELHEMMYEQVQHDLDDGNFKGSREVKRSDGWVKRVQTDRLNHLDRFVKRTPPQEESALLDYPLFLQELSRLENEDQTWENDNSHVRKI